MLRKVPTALNNQVVVAVCRLFPQWTTEAIHRYNSQWIFPWEYISVAICCGARSVLLSAELSLLDIKLPFWIYGRNLIFLDVYYLLAETVEAHTWNPITSRLINIHTGEIASLGDWYNCEGKSELRWIKKWLHWGNVGIKRCWEPELGLDC